MGRVSYASEQALLKSQKTVLSLSPFRNIGMKSSWLAQNTSYKSLETSSVKFSFDEATPELDVSKFVDRSEESVGKSVGKRSFDNWVSGSAKTKRSVRFQLLRSVNLNVRKQKKKKHCTILLFVLFVNSMICESKTNLQMLLPGFQWRRVIFAWLRSHFRFSFFSTLSSRFL
jgi:hypothetical protein